MAKRRRSAPSLVSISPLTDVVAITKLVLRTGIKQHWARTRESCTVNKDRPEITLYFQNVDRSFEGFHNLEAPWDLDIEAVFSDWQSTGDSDYRGNMRWLGTAGHVLLNCDFTLPEYCDDEGDAYLEVTITWSDEMSEAVFMAISGYYRSLLSGIPDRVNSSAEWVTALNHDLANVQWSEPEQAVALVKALDDLSAAATEEALRVHAGGLSSSQPALSGLRWVGQDLSKAEFIVELRTLDGGTVDVAVDPRRGCQVDELRDDLLMQMVKGPATDAGRADLLRAAARTLPKPSAMRELAQRARAVDGGATTRWAFEHRETEA
jgi:hypothetical protein